MPRSIPRAGRHCSLMVGPAGGWTGGMVLFLRGAPKEGLGVHQAGEGPAECTWTFPPGGHRYKTVWFIPLPHVSVPQGSI